MIAVVLAEARAGERRTLREALEAQRDLAVVGEAQDEADLLRLCFKVRPSVVLLGADFGRGAAATTSKLMHDAPVPVLVLETGGASAQAFEALRLGAVDVVARLGASPTATELTGLARQVRAASGVRLVRRRKLEERAALVVAPDAALPIVAIGASTGGPPALAQILSALPADFQAPVLVVQHMVEAFMGQFIDWLAGVVPLAVKQAEDGELLRAGCVYVGNGGHLTVDAAGCARVVSGAPVSGHRPSVDVLFSSLAQCAFSHRVGVLLTGMGEDGARGLEQLKRSGGYTLAQDERTSIVYGMPKAAAERGAVDEVLALELIGPRLQSLFLARFPRRRLRDLARDPA